MSTAVLIASTDVELLDDLLRLAAAADVEARVASDAVHARSAWRDASLVVAGPDLCAELAACAPPRRPGVILVTSDPDREGVYRLAVDIGAQDVAPLPDAEAVLGPVTALLQDLTEADRRTLAELINQCARQETDPERHLAAWKAPETLGLLT